MITTGKDLRRARDRLGWTIYEVADFLRIGGTTEEGARRVRAMEDDKRPIGGPTAVAMEMALEFRTLGMDARIRMPDATS